jgi:tetratricopeptide (TPR) repeat protein
MTTMVLRDSTRGLAVCALAALAGVALGCADRAPRGDARGPGRFPVPSEAALAAEAHPDLAEDLARAYGLAVDGQLGAARALVERHLAGPPDRVDPEQALFVLAVVQQRAHLNDQARALLEQVVARRPAFLSAYHHLGLSLYELGDLAGAREAFGVLRALRPGQANVAYQLGLVALAEGDLDEAGALFGEALDRYGGRNPSQLARCLVGLGDVAQRRGALAGAAADYERALAADPQCERAWYGLNRVLWRLGDEGRAREAGLRHSQLVASVDAIGR